MESKIIGFLFLQEKNEKHGLKKMDYVRQVERFLDHIVES
jgi:hypothetical protein